MKWSFGICLGSGVYLTPLINSIVKQQNLNPSDCEIIVVGTLTDTIISNLRIHEQSGVKIVAVSFDESLRSAWITRKKNFISEIASNDNICYMHDYVGLCVGWYDGFLKFGEDWDVSMNMIRDINGLRFRDWILATKPYGYPKLLSYDDANSIGEMYVSGTYWCAKKQYMLSNPLNEKLAWGQGEDIEWSYRCRASWNYRMNKLSAVKFLKDKLWNGVPEKYSQFEDPNYDETKHMNFLVQS